ncbi:MAG TPA: DUF3710 domain-containing protein [Mycobacteriales bacterium]|nr:DUF3710 domain-containing protein [Mycobacteriales bacterium]
MFGRRNKQVEVTEAEVDAFVDDLDPEERAREDAEILRELGELPSEERTAPVRPQGPWDSEDAPPAERVDLGALQVAIPPQVELRLELNPEGQVMAVTLVHGESTAQLNVFAAPRSEGIWGEVRQEIADALNGGGGRASEGSGVFGTELRAVVPNEVPGQGVVPAPARFVGVDGPRWFLRALLTGPAATEDLAARPLLEALRNVVVVRGTEPMPAREPLVLTLPEEAQQPGQPQPDDPGPALTMPERGPEITELH